MKENKIKIDHHTYDLAVTEKGRRVKFTESETRVKQFEQLELLEKANPLFATAKVFKEDETYIIEYDCKPKNRSFEEVSELERVDKLRAMINIAKLQAMIHTRYTFFLHPSNLVFDLNLMPILIHRGIKDVLPPYDNHEEIFLKQYQALVIAMFSKKYPFESLYTGSLNRASTTKFEKNIIHGKTVSEVVAILEEAFEQEMEFKRKNKILVSKKSFRLFRSLAIGFIVATLLLTIPISYFAFFQVPYQERLLAANEYFLRGDFDRVIIELRGENPARLPLTAQFQLAHSYVWGEPLNAEQLDSIMRNISLRSDRQYLLYWIHNGRGEFEESLDIARLLDDLELIIYSLTKKLEVVRNDSTLSGAERTERQNQIRAELERYAAQLDVEIDLQFETEDEESETEGDNPAAETGEELEE